MFLHTGTTDESFQQSRRRDSIRHLLLLKSSVSIWESSFSHFCRTTTGIQSGPDAFRKSILEVTVVLWSFGLVLEKKTAKEIADSPKLGFAEKSLATNFTLAEDNTLRRGVVLYLLLLRTLLAIRQKSQEPGFSGVMTVLFY